MKKLYLKFIFLFLWLPLLLVAQPGSEISGKVDQIVEDVKAEYHSDSRISVFDVDVRLVEDRFILKGEILNPEAKEQLVERLSTETDLNILDSLMVLPDPRLGEQTKGVVRVSVAQVRRDHNVDHEIITQALMGTKIDILKQRGWWLYVQLEDQYLGWLMKSAVVVGDAELIEKWDAKSKVIVTCNYGQVWESPEKECKISIGDVVLLNKLVMLDKKDDWYHVEFPDGRQGYIRADLVTELEQFENQSKPKPQSLIDLAFTFQGIPYFWGGRSPKGFDCSGFTQTIYKVHGITIPRDANMQQNFGQPVEIDEDWKNLKPCDLVFFGRSANRITHVGMYIGDGKFIHADGIVHINSFNPDDETYSEYRRKGLKVVRRILK